MGDQAAEAIIQHTRANITKYYMCYVILQRMIDDYDPDKHAYWLPSYTSMPALVRKEALRQHEDLYADLEKALPKSVMDRVSSQYTYGTNPRLTYEVQPDDGI